MKRLFATAAVSLALVTAPMAQAAAPERASLPMYGESEMGGGLPLSVIIVLLTVLGGAIYLAVDGDDSPDSP
jgi:hypothetical protein